MSAIYRAMINAIGKFVPAKLQPLWNHPAGPKTIFFWAPLGKWALVIASLGDLGRPAEKISVGQVTALALTGTVWSRYSVVIIPKNYSLLAVNVFVAISNIVQVFRAIQDKVRDDGIVIGKISLTKSSYIQIPSKQQ